MFIVSVKHGLSFSIKADSRKAVCDTLMQLMSKCSIPDTISIVAA